MAFVQCQEDSLLYRPKDTTDSPGFSYEQVANIDADIPQGAFKVGTHYLAKCEGTNSTFTLVGVWRKGVGFRFLQSDGSIGTKDSCKILCVKNNSNWEWQEASDGGVVKYSKANRFTSFEFGPDENKIAMFLGRRQQPNGEYDIGVVRKLGERYNCYIITGDSGPVENFEVLCAVL